MSLPAVVSENRDHYWKERKRGLWNSTRKCPNGDGISVKIKLSTGGGGRRTFLYPTSPFPSITSRWNKVCLRSWIWRNPNCPGRGSAIRIDRTGVWSRHDAIRIDRAGVWSRRCAIWIFRHHVIGLPRTNAIRNVGIRFGVRIDCVLPGRRYPGHARSRAAISMTNSIPSFGPSMGRHLSNLNLTADLWHWKI